MPADYDLYVSSSLYWNAMTIGSKNPMLVMGSNLLPNSAQASSAP